MRIHVVSAGETLSSIARSYGLDPARVAYDNGLLSPEILVPGQALLLLTPRVVHQVRAGETLFSIAADYGTTPLNIVRNNPRLTEIPYLPLGEELVIFYDDAPRTAIRVLGYAYPHIRPQTLRAALLQMSELGIFSYGFTPQGDLIPVPTGDEKLLKAARDFGVDPVFVLTPREGMDAFNNELVHIISQSGAPRDRLIQNITETVSRKGYKGVDVDFEFIRKEDGPGFVEFVRQLTGQMHALNVPVSVALAPKTSDDQRGLLYEGVDYAALGAAADSVLLMTYEWGYTYGPPMAVAPLPNVQRVLDYGLSRIPAQKIKLGIPNYGYDWPLPFVSGETKATTVGNEEAVRIAWEKGAVIRYDEQAQSPWFSYGEGGQEHVVWFEDVRSIRAKLNLVLEKGLMGAGYWNLLRPFMANWLLLNGTAVVET